MHPALDDPTITRGPRSWRQRWGFLVLALTVGTFFWRRGDDFTASETVISSVLALVATLLLVTVLASIIIARAAQRLGAVMDEREARAPDALRFPTYAFGPTVMRLGRALGSGTPASTFAGWAIVEVADDGVRVFRRSGAEPAVVIARSTIRDAGSGAIVGSLFRLPSLNLAVARRADTTGVPLVVLRTPLSRVDETELATTVISARRMLGLDPVANF